MESCTLTRPRAVHVNKDDADFDTSCARTTEGVVVLVSMRMRMCALSNSIRESGPLVSNSTELPLELLSCCAIQLPAAADYILVHCTADEAMSEPHAAQVPISAVFEAAEQPLPEQPTVVGRAAFRGNSTCQAAAE